MTEQAQLKGAALRAKIRIERGWATRRLLGQKPWHKQIEIETAIMDGKQSGTEISGCVGSTKTYALAMTALVWLLAYKPSRVFSIAPSFRQVDANLWGYIKQLWNAARKNGTPLGENGDILKIPRINFSCPPSCKRQHEHVADWYYEGFSTDEPHNVHGLHGVNDLVIIDDAHGIRKEMMDEIENIRAGGNTKIVLAYNKMVLSGPTYDCTHLDASSWNHVGINFDDLQAARAMGFQLDGALGLDAVERWKRKYGPKSNFFKVKVLNQHPTQEADTLIPLDWVELAFIRAERGEVPTTGNLILGQDVAGEGDDNNAQAPMRGMLIGEIDEWQEPDTMVTVGRIINQIKSEEAHTNLGVQSSKGFLFMDSCGLGGPMVNRVGEQNNRVPGHSEHCVGCQVPIKVAGLNGAESAVGRVVWDNKVREAEEIFVNLRSQMYWELRESLNPANPKSKLIGMVRDTDLSAQLSCIKFRTRSDGKIEVEPKIGLSVNKGGKANWGIKRRLGFSPDKADAVVYANWGRTRAILGGFQVAKEPETEARRPAGMGPEAPLTSSQLAARQKRGLFQTAGDDQVLALDGGSVRESLDGVD